MCNWSRTHLHASHVYDFQICDCEVFVNSAESTGCGGVYTSSMGDLPVNDMCANYCDACPDITPEEKMAQDFQDELGRMLNDVCKYSTEECKTALNNVHACASEQTGADELHPAILRFLSEKGHDMALEHAKLGDASLHREQAEPATVPSCPAEEGVTQVTCSANGVDADEALCAEYTSQYSVVCECYYFCGNAMMGCLANEEKDIFSCDQGPVTTCHGSNVEAMASSAPSLSLVGGLLLALYVAVM